MAKKWTPVRVGAWWRRGGGCVGWVSCSKNRAMRFPFLSVSIEEYMTVSCWRYRNGCAGGRRDR